MGIYESAVTGRRDFRVAYRRELERNRILIGLLREARERIPNWATGVNRELLTEIDTAITANT